MKIKDRGKKTCTAAEQAINSYNETVAGMHAALDKIRSDISDLHDKIDSSIAKLESKVTAKHIEIEKCFDAHAKAIEKSSRDISEVHSQMMGQYHAVSNRFLDHDNRYAQHHQVRQVKTDITDLELSHRDLILSIASDYANDHRKMKDEMADLKLELCAHVGVRITSLTEVLSTLSSELKESTQESKCMIQEVRAHKKDNYITDKHIEDLYTKLDRLKKLVEK